MTKWLKRIAFGIAMLLVMSCGEPASPAESLDAEDGAVEAVPFAEDVQALAPAGTVESVDSLELVASPQPSPTPRPTPTPRSDNVAGQSPPLSQVSITYAMMLTCEEIEGPDTCRGPIQRNPEFAQNETLCVLWREDDNSQDYRNLQIEVLKGGKEVASNTTNVLGNEACRKAEIRVDGSGDYTTRLAWRKRDKRLYWSISTPMPTDTPSPTATPPPTATTTPSSTPTSLPQEAAATSHSEKSTLVAFDSFNENVNDWATGDYSSKRITGNRSITSYGKYRWEATAEQDSIFWWVVPGLDTVSDFHLTVEAQRIRGSKDSRYGVVFRRDNHGNHYRFEIDGEQRFRFRMQYEGDWTILVGWTSTAAIRPDGMNQLRGIAEGPQFVFLINGQRVAQAENSRISRGEVGLVIALSDAGDEAVFEFDNFGLRTSVEQGWLYGTELVEKGRSLAQAGEIDEAVAAFEQAVEYDPRLEIPAGDWNTLCWFGTLSQQTEQVLNACEQAVLLSDGDVFYRDSRGVARAMTGDIEGAIADFEVFVQEYHDDALVAQRQAWIDMLKAGENPFEDEALLEELRQQ